jgi:predicted dehydrogenase
MTRVGVIGIGNISAAHIGAYLAFPERAEVVALCDIVDGKARKGAERFGLDVPCYPDHATLLAEAGADLVSVCTPPGTHAEITVDALRAGCNVLVEKPMAPGLDECDAMLAAQAESGKLLSVVAQNRFRTEMWRLHELLERGAAGKVLHAQVESLWWRGHSYYDLWWRGTWASEGGGPTLNHAVHHIDLLLWMMGAPAEVRAVMANVAHDNSEVEDLSAVLLRFANGALGQLTCSVVHHGQEQKLVFQGERARISAPFTCYASRSLENGFPERDSAYEAELGALYEAVPPLAHEGHDGQVDDVLRALETGSGPLVDGVQGRRTIELINAIYKAAITDGTVRLPLAADDPFATQRGLLERAPHFYEKSSSVAGFGDDRITTVGNY